MALSMGLQEFGGKGKGREGKGRDMPQFSKQAKMSVQK